MTTINEIYGKTVAAAAVMVLVAAGDAAAAQDGPQQVANAGKAPCGFAAMSPANAASTAAPGGETERLERRILELESQLTELQTTYESRLASIEVRLAALDAAPSSILLTDVAGADALGNDVPLGTGAALESGVDGVGFDPGDPAMPTAEPFDRSTAGGQAGEQAFQSQTRNLNEMNPEISATGDMFATFTDRTGDPTANQFRFAEFEVALQATLDPFSSAKFFVVQEGGEVELEEGYIEYNALPGNLGVKVGEMRLDWGKLNRWHQHALPQSQRPLVHEAFWGEDGLRGLGAALSWLPPTFLGDYNEVTVAVTNDDNDVSFSGRGFDDPLLQVHEINYFDLSSASYFELGLSYAGGVNDELGEQRTNVFGVDWNFNWSPPAEALYKGFELRGELLWQRPETPDGTLDNLGAYTYGVYKLTRRSFVGLRGDWTEIPQDPGHSVWGFSPYFEWWQSEWARLRFQYSYSSRRFEDPDPEHRFFFQLTWAIGPHKHEKY